MKITKSILASLIFTLLISSSVKAQSKAEVIAVINKASWCHVCEENGERVIAAFTAANKEGKVKFIGNDLSNEETKAKSAVKLQGFGLDKAIAEFNSTGVVYFFNAESKSFITKVSVARSNSELNEAVITATKSL